MPNVKIDYVVSFSSEDPDHQANNLLASEISRKKWLCNKGELSCSIVLQLVKAVKIESVNIGAHHVALIEILVGLSEKPNEPFQVLVPNCVLLTPAESRRDDGIEKVRFFKESNFASDTKLKKWDCVRVVCSQPYNRHCKYGLSFIHILEPEDIHKPSPVPSSSVPSRLLQLDTFSSDEEEFKPGHFFALSQKEKTNDTGAQIRQASSQALKNISDTTTKILKTPIAKTTSNKDQNRVNHECTSRKKDNLLYKDEDNEPHAKIDRVVQRHKESKKKEEKEENQGKVNDGKASSSKKEKQDGRKNTPNKKSNDSSIDLSVNNNNNNKRKRSDDELVPGPVRESRAEVLPGVVFALSGYVNPARAALRAAATALGAAYRPDWSPACTHLVCAFPNTPKLKTVRASKAPTVAVTGEWVEMCHSHRRRLPWQWFATEPHRRVTPPPGWDTEESGDTKATASVEEEMDTDDEIEKVLKKQKKKRLKSPSPEALDTPDENEKVDNKFQTNKKSEDTSEDGNISRDSDIAFVKDERIKANITIFESDSDTEEETKVMEDDDIDDHKELANFFDGCTFLITELDANYDRELLERYVRAYGGLVLKESDLLEDSTVDYEICSKKVDRECGSTRCHIRPEWVWDCHRDEQKLPTIGYQL